MFCGLTKSFKKSCCHEKIWKILYKVRDLDSNKVWE